MVHLIQKIFDKTFLRFVLVGLINTAVGAGVMFIAYNLFHADYWLSSAANYVVGGIVSFFLNKYYTFRNTEKGLRQVLRFVAILVICYFAAYGAAKPLVKAILSEQKTSLQENAAMLVGMGLYVILSYLGQRFFTFKEPTEK